MRTPLDLSIRDLKRFAIIIHGEYNTGKTHLAGDMLAYEREFGPVAYMNVKGEDGWQTITDMGHNPQNTFAETVETYDDMLGYLEDCKKKKIHALAVDSLRLLYNAVLVKVVGANRLPDASSPQKGGDGDRSRQLWGQARFQTEQFLGLMHYAADIVLVTCPSAKSENEITGEKRIAPDIYGAMANACIGAFDFAGFLKLVNKGPKDIERSVSFVAQGMTLTRQRLPNPTTEPIILPVGRGGWKAIKDALQKGMGSPQEEKK